LAKKIFEITEKSQKFTYSLSANRKF